MLIIQGVPLHTHSMQEYFSALWDESHDLLPHSCREHISIITLAVLLGLGITGTGTGVASLVLTYHHYSELCSVIDKDIQNLEKTISALGNSLVFLTEVVLQNRQ